MPPPLHARLATAAAGDAAAGGLPGPAPWDGTAWAGALLYALLFGAALAGIWLLIRPRSGEAGEPR